jgi:uncharacterized short protein YbdD (DUF466 family)
MSRGDVPPTDPVSHSMLSPSNRVGWLEVCGAWLVACGGRLVACGSGIRWYLRELMGDSSYARYLAHRATHNDPTPPLSERDFWRQKHRDDAASPRSRCC